MISNEYKPYELNILYRAQHSTMWELADKAGILASLGLSIKTLEFAYDSRLAEQALFGGAIDFVAGNHITPYLWVSRGKPIVCLASPGNSVKSSVVSKQPIESLAEFKDKGLRVADSNLLDVRGGIHHARGNHQLDVERAGYDLQEVQFLDMGDQDDPDTSTKIIDAVRTGKADVAFSGRGTAEALKKEGLYRTQLPTLPMINGTTLTTTYENIYSKEFLAERLVKALVLTIHYARMHPEEAQKYLDTKMGRPYEEKGGRATQISRYPLRAYPTTESVANAYELCWMQYEEAKAVSPLALWDIHYLRDLDVSGFIDELMQEEPENMRDNASLGAVSWEG
jgi:ABC-type nitrate/sulfonate/bicarbonate transport system substrate-binding protein